MKNNDGKKTKQLNTPVSEEWMNAHKKAVKTAGALLGIVNMDAFRFYYESATPEMEARRSIVVSEMRKLMKGKPLPFEEGRSSVMLPC